MIRLIAPPLPAASRPSKSDQETLAARAHPLLHLDEFGLEPLQLRLVELARNLRRLVVLHEASVRRTRTQGSFRIAGAFVFLFVSGSRGIWFPRDSDAFHESRHSCFARGWNHGEHRHARGGIPDGSGAVVNPAATTSLADRGSPEHIARLARLTTGGLPTSSCRKSISRNEITLEPPGALPNIRAGERRWTS